MKHHALILYIVGFQSFDVHIHLIRTRSRCWQFTMCSP